MRLFRLHTPRGFTLIECLIVVAIISIFVLGVGNTFFYVFHEQAALGQHFQVQQSANLVIESIAKDASRAKTVKKGNVPSSIVFELETGENPPRSVMYQKEETRLVRTILRNNHTHKQVLADQMKTFITKLEKGLLHVRIRIEKKRYRKTFAEDYQTSFAIKEGK